MDMKPRVEHCSFRGLPAIKIVAIDGSSALITEYGGHVISWVDDKGTEHLYLSEKAAFTEGEPIRGGIPVAFPQFARRGALPHHGVVRTVSWRLVETGVDDAGATATLQLTDNPQTRALWSAAFMTTIRVRIAPALLETTLIIDNTGHEPFTFTAALHTYLKIEAIEEARLEGLHGVLYSDNSDGNRVSEDTAKTLQVQSEIDRVYANAPSPLVLHEQRQRMSISSEGFPDVVVWNPWREKCAGIVDMPADGYTRMLCVEAAIIAQLATLAPGARWQGTQRLISELKP